MIKYNIINWMLSDDCKVVKCFLLFKVENHNGEFANLFFLKREKINDKIFHEEYSNCYLLSSKYRIIECLYMK